jgi:hypothetical protein
VKTVCRAGQVTDALWVTGGINTLPYCVVLIAVGLYQQYNDRTSTLRCPYIDCTDVVVTLCGVDSVL